MTFLSERDLSLEIPAGNIPGKSSVNKFGRATKVDAVLTDVWDRANAIDLQPAWPVPTVAQQMIIVSTLAADTNLLPGGAWQIELFGLQTWNSAETSEVINLNGVIPVLSLNTYVIVHRIKLVPVAGSAINAGDISCFAALDGVFTAQINAGQGQTQMAVYGVPSIETHYLTCFYANMNKSTPAAGSTDIQLVVNEAANFQPPVFVVKGTQAILSTGTSLFRHCFEPYFRIPGPAIVKIQATGSALNQDISAGFDIIKVTNA